jgi:hypothetical protein
MPKSKGPRLEPEAFGQVAMEVMMAFAGGAVSSALRLPCYGLSPLYSLQRGKSTELSMTFHILVASYWLDTHLPSLQRRRTQKNRHRA